MKSALAKLVGSKFPVKITPRDGETIIRYVRGFADQQSDVLLISETSFSMALKIIEVVNIKKLEFATDGTDGTWQVLLAKWIKDKGNPLAVFLAVIAASLCVSL